MKRDECKRSKHTKGPSGTNLMLKIIPNRELFCNFPFGLIFFCTFATVSQVRSVCQAEMILIFDDCHFGSSKQSDNQGVAIAGLLPPKRSTITG